MIYWNMYLPNILVVYTLMKNIFYLESIKSDGFKNLLIVIIYLIYFYIFNILPDLPTSQNGDRRWRLLSRGYHR